MPRLQDLLAGRGARLEGNGPHAGAAQARRATTALLAEHYAAYSPLRLHLVNAEAHPLSPRLSGEQHQLVDHLVGREMIARDGPGLRILPGHRQYLLGAWLEEWVFLAVLEAGCDEALSGQKLSWQVPSPLGGAPLRGENEVDLVARRDDRLLFVSCKAMRAHMTGSDRNRVRAAIHEADDLVDHFGSPGDLVALVVSADLIDEHQRRYRHPGLVGKSQALSVHLIGLEDFPHQALATRFLDMWNAVPAPA